MKLITNYLLGSLLVLTTIGCGAGEELPPERSSIGLGMDGAHGVPFTGSVNQIAQTNALSESLSPGGWSTAPVPLKRPLGFAIGTRTGSILIYDDEDSLEHTIKLNDSTLIDQILVRGSLIYPIGLDGSVWCVDGDGKIRWSTRMDRDVNANAVITTNGLFLPVGKSIVRLDLQGKYVELFTSALDIHSLAWSSERSALLVAATRNESGGDDSLYVLGADLKLRHAIGLKETRFTSNLAIIEGQDLVAFGYLGGFSGGIRHSHVTLLRGVLENATEPAWRHELPYIVMNVAANASDVIASGVRARSGEIASGIDAFRLDDTIKTWSRRFSEPLAAPVAVSDGNVYMHLSFESEAMIGTRGIFYTLDAETGKTTRELPVDGALFGFLPQLPMPDERGRFLLADRTRLLVYLLDRSSFERVFK